MLFPSTGLPRSIFTPSTIALSTKRKHTSSSANTITAKLINHFKRARLLTSNSEYPLLFTSEQLRKNGVPARTHDK